MLITGVNGGPPVGLSTVAPGLGLILLLGPITGSTRVFPPDVVGDSGIYAIAMFCTSGAS